MIDTRPTEEILKSHRNLKYVRTDRNGTRYFKDYTCGRCGGRGGWEGWPGFTCYDCGGSGIDDRGYTIKVYTPEHAAKLEAQRQARAEKAQKEREAKAIAERGQNLLKAGFGKEDSVYVIYRVVGNTYEIKDALKALGCKFNPTVGWFAPTPLEGYECQRFEEKDVLTDSIFIEWKEKKDIEETFVENIRRREESTSRPYGEVGERIDIQVHIDRVFESSHYRNSGWYGTSTSYMYLMHDAAGNIFKWSTSCYYEEGDDVHFRATVKEHSEYKGVAQTVLTRCTKVKE